MANLAARSVLVFALLFGLLFAIGMAAVAYWELSLWFAVGFAIAVVFLQYLLGPYIISWIYRIEWGPPEAAGEELGRFLRDSCHRLRLPLPRFGIIRDGNPNAFTFGHYPGDARLVVTSGLLEMLDENEREAVVAHELGHIIHWDFVVMTMAAVVPLVLYVIYVTTRRTRGRGRSGAAAGAIAIASFIAYLISQYIVLLLSRVREYYADNFSGRFTRDPNALSSSLVKIAYGLARAPKREEGGTRPVLSSAARSLGIFDPAVASSLAAASAASGSLSPETIAHAMRWDLWNPWGTVFELHSSHPLPAKRIKALDRLSYLEGQQPKFDFPSRPPESYYDEFAADLSVAASPYLGAIIGALGGYALFLYSHSPAVAAGLFLFILGATYLMKVRSMYPSASFPPAQVKSLVSEVKVSAVRAIPCTLSGRVIGRGVPGLYWSEDLVLQDDTGFLVMDYRQPLGILEFLFGLFKADQFIGRTLRARGWYRRAPRPYLELRDAVLEDGRRIRCYLYHYRLLAGVLGLLLGLGLLLAGPSLGSLSPIKIPHIEHIKISPTKIPPIGLPKFEPRPPYVPPLPNLPFPQSGLWETAQRDPDEPLANSYGGAIAVRNPQGSDVLVKTVGPTERIFIVSAGGRGQVGIAPGSYRIYYVFADTGEVYQGDPFTVEGPTQTGRGTQYHGKEITLQP